MKTTQDEPMGPVVMPAWAKMLTVPEFKQKISDDFVFKGSGWYLSEDECLLVVPVGENQPWKQTWPPGTVFMWYAFGCPFHKTIFASGLIPTRDDSR